MDQNKEKSCYILHHFDKGENALQAYKKNVIFMVKVLYQNQQHSNGSLAIVLEISMSKMIPVLVGQLPKKVMFSSQK